MDNKESKEAITQRFVELHDYLISNHLASTSGEIFEKLGKNQQYMSGYRNGSRYFSIDLIEKLNKSYGVNKNWLLKGEGEMLLSKEALTASLEEEELENHPYIQRLKKALAHKDAQIEKIEADNEYLKLLLEGKS